METLAEGRVAEPLESFIELLKRYKKTDECPLRVIGAIKMRLHFCLMARYGVPPDLVKKVVAHPKGARCLQERDQLRSASQTMSSLEQWRSSPARGTRSIASSEYTLLCALGPKSAAEKYGLMAYLNEGIRR